MYKRDSNSSQVDQLQSGQLGECLDLHHVGVDVASLTLGSLFLSTTKLWSQEKNWSSFSGLPKQWVAPGSFRSLHDGLQCLGGSSAKLSIMGPTSTGTSPRQLLGLLGQPSLLLLGQAEGSGGQVGEEGGLGGQDGDHPCSQQWLDDVVVAESWKTLAAIC